MPKNVTQPKYADSVPHYLIYSTSKGAYYARQGWTLNKSGAFRFDEKHAARASGIRIAKGELLFEYCGHIARGIG